MTLQHLLISVNTRRKAELDDEVTVKLSKDWRYVQQFLSPEWLVHFAAEISWRPDVGYHIGVMASTQEWIMIEITESAVRSWLDDNIGTSDGNVDEAFRVIESYLNGTIKSHDGTAKARRLLQQLKQMSKVVG
jgi:hypothetical protein